jgi:hypothetical protein
MEFDEGNATMRGEGKRHAAGSEQYKSNLAPTAHDRRSSTDAAPHRHAHSS